MRLLPASMMILLFLAGPAGGTGIGQAGIDRVRGDAFGQGLPRTARGTVRDTIDAAVPAYLFFASGSYMSITNFDSPSASMYELYLGYRITPKDVVALKACTWSLFEPLGIPFGPHLQQESEFYPGRIREYGVGLSYQRSLWRGLYTSVQVLPLIKTYLDEHKKKVDDGFRLYTSYHVGYHVPLLKNRFFLEPQVHCNYWPINTKGPRDFEAKEGKWNNYFLFEPNLFIGVNF